MSGVVYLGSPLPEDSGDPIWKPLVEPLHFLLITMMQPTLSQGEKGSSSGAKGVQPGLRFPRERLWVEGNGHYGGIGRVGSRPSQATLSVGSSGINARVVRGP